MNKRAAQSGFVNLRVLIGMFIMLPGVVLALAGFGIAQAQQKQFTVKSTNSIDPLVISFPMCCHSVGCGMANGMQSATQSDTRCTVAAHMMP